MEALLSKIDPTNFTFTVLVYTIVVAALLILWFKLIPDYLNKERPFQRELKMKRIQAEIDLKKEELLEQRMMRQAVERLGGMSERIAMLLELHDKTARTGIEQIQGLLRIVLEKQGVAASEIAKFLAAPEENSPVITKLRELLEIDKQPEGKPA